MYNDMFVAGIIHDIGKLILFIALQDEYLKIINFSHEKEIDINIIENRSLGTTHSQVGMDLLRRWMFPEKLLMAVGFHHSPMKTTKEKTFPIIIHISDLLTYFFTKKADGFPVEAIDKKLSSPEISDLASKINLDWSSSKKEELLEKIEVQREKEMDILNLFLS